MSYLFTLLLTTQILTAGEFEVFKSKSIDQGKATVLVFSGSDWCIPCIKYKKSFLEHESFKDFKEQNLSVFIADFPHKKKNKPNKERQKENELLISQFNPEGKFPFTVVFDKNGKVVKKWEGNPFNSIGEMKTTFSTFIK
jgi:thioredoxin-related protein